MKASNTAHERTRPVALRKNRVASLTVASSENGELSARPAPLAVGRGRTHAHRARGTSFPSACRQSVVSNAAPRIQFYHGPLKHALLVQAARVDGQRLPQARD